MRSLRRQLLISLWVAVSTVGVLSAILAYRQVNSEAKDLLDHQLQQVAAIVAEQTAGVPRSFRTDEDIEVGIWDTAGKLQYSSTDLMRVPLATTPGFTEKTLGAEPYRIYTTLLGGRHIEIAQPVDTREDQAESAALAAFLPVFVLLPVLAIAIALVIRALLQPVREVAAAVSRRDVLSSEALEAQSLPKEILPLVEEINRLLERQGLAVQRERHFIADAAHALRTPLAALQLQTDVLDGSADPLERAMRLQELRAGIQRATRLTEQLLSLARIESATDIDGQTMNMDEALQEVHALYGPTATAAGITLRFHGNAKLRVRGDLPRLLLIYGNLLDNAIRYTPSGGQIELLAAADGEMARIEIWDEGPGLEPPQFERVFERFYSGPGSPSTSNGLGLATVESVVKQLGGRVSLHNRTDRIGLIARVLLPRISDTPKPSESAQG